MPSARVAFTESDIKRAIRATVKAGREVAAVDFPREGGFRLVLGDRIQVEQGSVGKNEWDDVLAS